MVRNNVTRQLDKLKIWYEPFEYDASEFHSATEVAAMAGAPAAQVFKTIVALPEGRGKRPLLVIVPANAEVDLKRVAAGVGEKRVRVATHREAETLTKLRVGGISALALLDKGFNVVLDRSAEGFAEAGIYVSAGQRGLNLRVRPADFVALTGARVLDATRAGADTLATQGRARRLVQDSVMALSLWQGPSRLGDISVHRVVSHRGSGYSVCILACLTFNPEEYCPGTTLELRNGRGERLDICLQTMLYVPGSAFVGEFDGTRSFDWAA
jgi:Cys-tRNA(Pro)/Cys-tRNA(Cys) deacylase